MSIKIGNVTLRHGLFLAPMAGVTDRSFRAMCREYGAEYTVSEMVCAKAMCYEELSRSSAPSKSGVLAAVSKAEMPMAVQIFGSEPEFMAEAAKMIANCSYRGCTSKIAPAAIDINMGCPVKKIVSNGEGSALMKNPELCGKIVEAVVAATTLPVTVKIRAGWDKESVNAVEVAKICEAAGAAAICVHARTREQMYLPGVDVSIIGKVKETVRVPVIGNGDIYTADDAIKMMRDTGCDGVMVARGATGAPWLFSEIAAALDGKDFTPPSDTTRLAEAKRLLFMMIADKGERIGTAEAKKQIAWFIKDVRGAAEKRNAVMCAEGSAAIAALLDTLIEESEARI